MQLSTEDALLLLEKWKNEEAVIVVFFEAGPVTATTAGQIRDLTPEQVRVQFREQSLVTVRLRGCQFIFGDQRLMPEKRPEEWFDYNSFLMVRSGDYSTILFEVPQPAGDDGDDDEED